MYAIPCVVVLVYAGCVASAGVTATGTTVGDRNSVSLGVELHVGWGSVDTPWTVTAMTRAEAGVSPSSGDSEAAISSGVEGWYAFGPVFAIGGVSKEWRAQDGDTLNGARFELGAGYHLSRDVRAKKVRSTVMSLRAGFGSRRIRAKDHTQTSVTVGLFVHERYVLGSDWIPGVKN